MDQVRRYLPALPGPGTDRVKYAPVAQSRENGDGEEEASVWLRKRLLLPLVMLGSLVAGMGMAFATSLPNGQPFHYFPSDSGNSCDSVYHGFHCQTSISHYWGQYSPYFSVPSEIAPDIPAHCEITFAQVLSRHGARDPTASKTEAYAALIDKIQSNVETFDGDYAFLKDYEYTLGANQLTHFGQREMLNAGVQFYERYAELARDIVPFVRASGEQRVVESALNWTQGLSEAKAADRKAEHGEDAYPAVDVIIPEADYGVNNTLNHALCTAFENGTYSTIADSAESTWASIFAQPIRARLNRDLPGANLTLAETIYLMDLCPFNTVASPSGAPSAFCALFTEEEWHQYNYYETLDKFYGYSYGNPLGPAQGIGWASELIARMTDMPVDSVGSVNATLDADPAMFPLGRKLYADFGHDNDMTAIFAALGLYNGTGMLPNTTVVEAEAAGGYSAAWTVPFAGRAYFEKMRCRGAREEMVRVVVNDRVVPLKGCGVDGMGMCKLTAFIDSLEFARSGGNWEECFT